MGSNQWGQVQFSGASAHGFRIGIDIGV